MVVGDLFDVQVTGWLKQNKQKNQKSGGVKKRIKAATKDFQEPKQLKILGQGMLKVSSL